MSRIFAQYVSLLLSLLIMVFSLMSCKFRPDKIFSSILWFSFGMVGFFFYAYIIFLPHPKSIDSSDLSAIRTLIQYTEIAVWLGAWNFWNWKKRK